MDKSIIVLTGPTAVGKTALSIELAKALGGEIINADSAQVYRGFDIGTAKITEEEMEGIPHHLFGEVDPMRSYSVKDYQMDARKYVADIHSRNKIPIVVGGTGMYIKALVYDWTF
ncbi:MAG: tRNA (adenosine(37)-N6)-dimethylallyltransferase, partial [Bacilli bacterium]